MGLPLVRAEAGGDGDAPAAMRIQDVAGLSVATQQVSVTQAGHDFVRDVPGSDVNGWDFACGQLAIPRLVRGVAVKRSIASGALAFFHLAHDVADRSRIAGSPVAAAMCAAAVR